ncbi:MAG: inorganic phosphate transporter [Bacteroidaceae bacterium]|nr:inorganic phosphate transporter [Bacteroidaceae bacterium]
MEYFYFAIICVLFVFAIIDLNVGVSNDAVNFLNSAVGAKAASLKMILLIAAIGIFIGASTSSGMMDIARHGMFQPEHFYFRQLMCVFLAVTVTDVVLLDIFNSLGMPTSTTVSMVFELLGASFAISLIKINSGESLEGVSTLGDLLNTGKALEVIAGIFLSVAIAFFFGVIVQWIARLIFTYNYKKGLGKKIGLFGGVAVTSILYFMLFKGMKNAAFMTPDVKAYLNEHTLMLLGIIFVVSTILMQFLHALKVNIFKVIILIGTFALAMAFAGNDLVNFIGVTMAALDSVLHFAHEAVPAGISADEYMMGFLNEPAQTSVWFLIGAGAIMVFALRTSKKAHEVLKTSINLSRQDEGDEMFGSSSMARKLVRAGMGFITSLQKITPKNVKRWIAKRFDQEHATLDEGAAFDLVRASVNLVLAGLLIALGTSLKLPLSTTYVTFMVGMGSSLADHAWGRESAVFRITGVISVIGGWFLTAGAAFILAGIVSSIMYFGGPVAMVIMAGLALFLLFRSHISYKNKKSEDVRDVKLDIVLNSEDTDEVWTALSGHTADTLCHTLDYAADTYEGVIRAFAREDVRKLRAALSKIVEEKAWLKKMRRHETLGFRRIDKGLAFEKNTWYYLSSNNAQQILNTLTRITNPMKEHTDNNFRPLSPQYLEEFAPYQKRLVAVFRGISEVIRTGDFTEAEKLSAEGKWLKKEISNLRRVQTHRLQEDADNIKVAFVYLNLIQESHELLSEVRNVLRGCEKFFGENVPYSMEEADAEA